MNREKISQAFNEIDDRYILEAERYQAKETPAAAEKTVSLKNAGKRPKRRISRGKQITRWVAVAACLCVCLVGVAGAIRGSGSGLGKAAAAETTQPAYYAAEETWAAAAAAGDDWEMAADEAMPEEAAMVSETMAGGNSAGKDAGDLQNQSIGEMAKIIYTGRLTLQTTEYEQAEKDIKALVEELGGFLENSSSSSYGSGYRYANFTIRVPAEVYDSALERLAAIAYATSTESSAENISASYYDTKSRLETAQTKLHRLQELLAKAENMEDIIVIENEISNVEWDIDYYSGQLKNYDNLTGYSTIYVSLDEVYKLSNTEEAPLSLGDRVGNAFRNGFAAIGDFFENLIVWIAYNWIWLLVVVIAAVFGIRFAKKAIRKAAPEEPDEETEEEKDE